MKFKDKYSSATENDSKKLVMSNGAYAVGEMLEEILDKLEQVRVSMGGK